METQRLILTSKGYEFHTDKKKYSLYEGISIGTEKPISSDILFIMDDQDPEETPAFVGFLYGADFTTHADTYDEWERYISRIVNQYESGLRTLCQVPAMLRRKEAKQ